AGAVLAKQAEDLARLDCQRNPAQGLDAAVVLVQGAGLDDGHAGCSGEVNSVCIRWANRERNGKYGRRRSFPSLPLCSLRLFDADKSVAGEVEALEVVVGAEELAARHVAVAVAVHVAEPERAAGRHRSAGCGSVSGGRHAPIREFAAAAAGGQEKLPRDLGAGQKAVAVSVPNR